MLKKLILFTFLFLLPLAAEATVYATGTGSTPIIIFPNHAQRTIIIQYVAATTINGATNDAYDFIPVSGDNNAWDYVNNYLASPPNYALSPPVLASVQGGPNFIGFTTDCLTDASIPIYPTALFYCLAMSNQNLTANQRSILQGNAYNSISSLYPIQASALKAQITTYLTNRAIPLNP